MRFLREYLLRRRIRRELEAWALQPCPPSYAEPWLSAGERKHWKGGA